MRKLSTLSLILGFCLGLGSLVGSSRAQGTGRGGLKQRQNGNGPGVKVAHPPPLRPAASVLKPEQTGYCLVPIRNSYRDHEWRQQQECLDLPDSHTWLVTIRNESTVPVFINEWDGALWQGETMLRPGETKLLPLWAYARVWIGACWPGAGGPGTCKDGPADQKAVVRIMSWLNSTFRHELWFREDNFQGVPKEEGTVVAVNESEFTIELWWSGRAHNDWVTLRPKERSEPIPFRSIRTVHGKKDLGTGAAARVTFTKTAGVDEDTYLLVTPGTPGPGNPPIATMTFLFDSWCGVRLENLGPNSVVLTTWPFPGFPTPPQTGPGLTLDVGKSETLRMKSGTFEITGQVGTGRPGSFTTLKATNWQKCP